MKAVVYDRYGPPEVLRLEDVERPVPEEDEILVKIRATTVNRTDCGWRSAKPFITRYFLGLARPKRKILGMELAGEVEAVGAAVAEFEVGDQVFGVTGFGAHAEFVCIRESASVAHKPANMTFEEAAAVCDGACIALDVIFDAVGKHSFRRCRRSLKRDGMFIETDPGFLWHVPILALLTRRFGEKNVRLGIAKYTKKDVLFLKELIEAEKYRAVIDRRYPLEDVVEASRFADTQQKTGNVVLTVNERGRQLRTDAATEHLRGTSGTRRALAVSLRRAADRLDPAPLARRTARSPGTPQLGQRR